MNSTVLPEVTKEEQLEIKDKVTSKETHIYKKRYYVLLLFIMLSASNAMQWIEYSIIAHIIVRFYSVSYVAVDWTSMIYMLTYILFVLPASWVLDKYGVRVSVLLGAGGNCIGAWLRLFSAKPDGFWITFISQTIVGSSQIFILGMPSRLAATWFGPEQVSTACAAGVFGNQLGIAIGFLLPPMIVHMGTTDDVASDLTRLFLTSVIANTIIFLLIIFSFPQKPLLPPSLAQLQVLEDTKETHYFQSLKQLLKNSNFILLFITYGINAGVFYAVSTLLSQVILMFHPDEQESTGTIGLLLVLAGMFGSVICGMILDRFHQFRLTIIGVYLFSTLGMFLFTFVVDFLQMWCIYASAIFLGFFMTGYLPIGFEFAVELTFPVTEGTTSGLLNASAQILGIVLTLTGGFILQNFSAFASNLTFTGFLVAGTLLTALIKSDLRRQNVQKVSYTLPQASTELAEYI